MTISCGVFTGEESGNLHEEGGNFLDLSFFLNMTEGWCKGRPPMYSPLVCKASDARGDYVFIAKAIPYKKPPKKKPENAYRFVKEDGTIVRWRDVDHWTLLASVEKK